MRRLLLTFLLFLVLQPVTAQGGEGGLQPGSPLGTPVGVASVASSPHARAVLNFMTVGNNPSVTFVDGFMPAADVRLLESGKKPAGSRLMLASTPADARMRHLPLSSFAQMVASAKKKFIDQMTIDKNNADLRAQGSAAQLVSASVDRVLLDNPRCFAAVIGATYDPATNAKMSSKEMFQAYLLFRGELIVINGYMQKNAGNDEWLNDDVKTWLSELASE